MTRALLALAAVLVLSGCSFEPRLTDQSVLYVDTWVKRNNPEFYVEPLKSPPAPLSALVAPFRVTQDIAAPRELGAELTRILWQTWARDRVFPKLVFEQGLIFAPTPQLVAKARQMGLPLVVTGAVTYIYSGGTRGDSALSLNVEILDAATGERIWSMAHAGRMETGLNEDYILFARKNRMPQEPLQAIVSVLAADLGSRIANWNYGAVPPPPAGPNPAPPPPPPAQ